MTAMARNNRHQFHPQSWIHPGETLSEKLGEMGMDTKTFSVKAALPEKLVQAVLRTEHPVTPHMAAAFEKVTLIPASYWLNCQKHYDAYKSPGEKGESSIFRRIATL